MIVEQYFRLNGQGLNRDAWNTSIMNRKMAKIKKHDITIIIGREENIWERILLAMALNKSILNALYLGPCANLIYG